MIKERFSVKEFLVAIATDLTLTQPPGYLNILHLIKIYQHVKVTSVKLLKLIQSIPIGDGNPAKKNRRIRILLHIFCIADSDSDSKFNNI